MANGIHCISRNIQESKPLSVFQIRADAICMSKFSCMNLKRMIAMITPQCSYVSFNLGAILMHTNTFPLCFTLGNNGPINWTLTVLQCYLIMQCS